jgi:Fe-S-cluster containining protein
VKPPARGLRPPRIKRVTGDSEMAIARRSLLRADKDLVEEVDAVLAKGARRAGDNLACHAGCSECCHGPFPINRLDSWRLREGLEALRASDPARAEAIVERARRQAAIYHAGFPGDPDAGRLGGDEGVEDLFFERHAGVPCPVLDPATQTCDLYAHRPISCRTYGPPVTFGGEKLPPCRLCFTTATPATIEESRVNPDPMELERAILSRLRRDGGDDRETIIAYAVLEKPERAEV